MAYLDESLGSVLLHHLHGAGVNLACRDTFAQWDTCDVHEGRLFNRDVPVSMRDPRCQNCCTSNQPAIKLTVAIRHSDDLIPICKAWQQTFSKQETEQVTMDGESRNDDGSSASRRSDKFQQLKFNIVEPARWTQYWLAAWAARSSVIPLLQKGIALTEGKQKCMSFMRSFVDDWQLRHPEVARFEGNMDESHGQRPYMQCQIHKKQGAMFPIADPHVYNPECFVCLLPPSASSASPALPKELSSSEFNELCGPRKNDDSFASSSSYVRAAATSAASSSDERYMRDVVEDDVEEEQKEMS